MVYTLADNVDTMIDNQRIVLPEQGQEMGEHTPCPQPLEPAPRPGTLDPGLRLQTPETSLLSWLEYLWCLKMQNPRLEEPTLLEVDPPRSSSDMDMYKQLMK
jgi:hypothetical protein